MSEILNYDLVIIGGGPAGLTAGLYAGRALLKTVMLEKMMPGGQVSITAELENYPGIDSISGPELIINMEEQAKKFGLEIRSEEVESIDSLAAGKGHLVKTSENTYLAKAVVITTGASARRLGCLGEEEHIGRGVSYCATCDGAFFRNKEIVVVGGGDSAVEEAIFLTRFASKVTIIHRRDKLRASKIIQQRAMANEKISFLWDSVVTAIEGTPTVSNIKVQNVKTKEFSDFKTDGVFIFVGYQPATEFLPDALKKDSQGFLITDDNMQTNILGVFAAGDVRSKLLRQVVTACSDGATAVFAAEKFIEWAYHE